MTATASVELIDHEVAFTIWKIVDRVITGSLSGALLEHVPVEAFIGRVVRHDFRKRDAAKGGGMHPVRVIKLVSRTKIQVVPHSHRNSVTIPIDEVKPWWIHMPYAKDWSATMQDLRNSKFRHAQLEAHKVVGVLAMLKRVTSKHGCKKESAASLLDEAQAVIGSPDLRQSTIDQENHLPTSTPAPVSAPVEQTNGVAAFPIVPRDAKDVRVPDTDLLDVPAPEVNDHEECARVVCGKLPVIDITFPVKDGVLELIAEYNRHLVEAHDAAQHWFLAQDQLRDTTRKLQEAGFRFTDAPEPVKAADEVKGKRTRRPRAVVNAHRKALFEFLSTFEDGSEIENDRIRDHFMANSVGLDPDLVVWCYADARKKLLPEVMRLTFKSRRRW